MTSTAERTRIRWDQAASWQDHDLDEARRPDLARPLADLAIRELISLLARTEDQLHRLGQEDVSLGGRPDLRRRLLRQQNEVIGELRRRRGEPGGTALRPSSLEAPAARTGSVSTATVRLSG